MVNRYIDQRFVRYFVFSAGILLKLCDDISHMFNVEVSILVVLTIIRSTGEQLPVICGNLLKGPPINHTDCTKGNHTHS